MLQLLITIIVVALLATFVDLFLKKIEVVKYFRINGLHKNAPEIVNKFVADMFSCDFCFSWWTNVLICLTLSIVFQNWWFMIIPPFATPITMKFQS